MSRSNSASIDRGPGSGPDECVICGEDASHTLGRYCSSECAEVSLRKDERGLDSKQASVCLFANSGGDHNRD